MKTIVTRFSSMIGVLACLALLCCGAFAQSGTSSVRGTVADATGKV